MLNEDVKNELVTNMKAKIESGDTQGFAQDLTDYVNGVEAKIRKDFEDYKASQEVVLPKGYRACTTAEKKWLDSAITIAKTKGATTQSLSDVDVAMPETIINDIFEEIKTNHELLNVVDLVNSKSKVKWIFNTGINGAAGWGDLCDEVEQEIKSGFKAEEIVLQKLSAYMFVCLTLLDLGYEWLMRFCVEVLGEAIAVALEDAMINGNGSKKPIGMIKDIVVDAEDGTTTIETKTPVELTSLDAGSLGGIAATLSNSGKRKVGEMIMVVNSYDYYTKVMPAIAYKNALGEYVVRTPLPIRIIQCEAVASGKAVIGLGKLYKMVLGLGEDGKLTYSDDFKFLDDMRTLKQKLVGNGRPRDNYSFVYCDISGLAPDYFNVEVHEISA